MAIQFSTNDGMKPSNARVVDGGAATSELGRILADLQGYLHGFKHQTQTGHTHAERGQQYYHNVVRLLAGAPREAS